jgi:hypothetical protein
VLRRLLLVLVLVGLAILTLPPVALVHGFVVRNHASLGEERHHDGPEVIGNTYTKPRKSI